MSFVWAGGWRREKFLSPAWIRGPERPGRSLVLSRLRCSCTNRPDRWHSVAWHNDSFVKWISKREILQAVSPIRCEQLQLVELIPLTFHVKSIVSEATYELHICSASRLYTRLTARNGLKSVWDAREMFIHASLSGLPSRRSGYGPRPFHVEFVVDQVALEQVFLRVLRLSAVTYHPHQVSLHRALLSLLFYGVPTLRPYRSSIRIIIIIIIIIIESANVKVQNIFHRRNNITCSTKCKYRTAATL